MCIRDSYYAGRKIDAKGIRTSEGYTWWERNLPDSYLIKELNAMINDADRDNNYLLLPEDTILEAVSYTHLDVYKRQDLENFKYFNRKYVYAAGDQLLREFTGYIIDTLKKCNTAHFTRVVADQFLLFFEEKWNDTSIDAINRINSGFIERQQRKYPEAKLRLRTGVYKVEGDCAGASFAIDAANYARHQIQDNSPVTVCVYDKTMACLLYTYRCV